ncbi:hypothetical protein JJB07_09700 [Tumebacillus sp. ITR2]|uniref:Uncharacterized protein n=1 Tax=Tumebacillus amylolyticus TaxID=2801339 RepID=A0ABS1J9H4_9BACL|nr:hypothetical protein [Tumebacillus amylolyticus]MBL0386927.1 hypothetical protein [Tumebacillus amylolyticus]
MNEVERKLRKLEARLMAEVGPMRRAYEMEDDEKARIIMFMERYFEANTGTYRDQSIRQYILYRLSFPYQFG